MVSTPLSYFHVAFNRFPGTTFIFLSVMLLTVSFFGSAPAWMRSFVRFFGTKPLNVPKVG